MIDIVIVNWNAGDQLVRCVESVRKQGGGKVCQIIVIDNGSTDGSDVLIESQPGVTLIRAGENLGFGKACNLGAGYAKSEFLLFLNPDAAVYPETLSKVLSFMRDPANERVGICGVQLMEDSGHVARSCSRFPSVSGLFAHAAGVDRFLPCLGVRMGEWDHSDVRNVDQVIGAFFFVRRSLFDALNGFDERFFVYFEEVDFSYRAFQAGWRSVYLADAQAFHAGGGTSNQVKARRLFYSLRSRLLYASKHFSVLGVFGIFLATFLLEPVSRSALAVARQSWSGLRETLAAYGMLWRWLPQWAFKGATR